MNFKSSKAKHGYEGPSAMLMVYTGTYSTVEGMAEFITENAGSRKIRSVPTQQLDMKLEMLKSAKEFKAK
jgi:hypothetical protein